MFLNLNLKQLTNLFKKIQWNVCLTVLVFSFIANLAAQEPMKRIENEFYKVDVKCLSTNKKYLLIVTNKKINTVEKIEIKAWDIIDGFINGNNLFLTLHQYTPTRPEEDNWFYDLSTGKILGQYHCTESFPSPDKSWVVSVEEFGSNGFGPSQSDEIALSHIEKNKIDHWVINGEGEKAHPGITYPEANGILDAKKIPNAKSEWYWKVFSDGLWSTDSNSVWFVVGDLAYRQNASVNSSGLRYQKYLLIGLKLGAGARGDLKFVTCDLGLDKALGKNLKNITIYDDFIRTEKAIEWGAKNEVKISIEKLPLEKVKKRFSGKTITIKLPSGE